MTKHHLGAQPDKWEHSSLVGRQDQRERTCDWVVTVSSRSLSFRFEESNETGQGGDIIQKNLLPGNARDSLGGVAGWRFLREAG